MPADPRPQTWRETRSPALAPLPFLKGAEGRAGQDGWQAVPPGRRLITDAKPRRRPRLIRKSAGAAAGPRGAPRASLPAPRRALLPPCAPLPCALPSRRAPASPRAPGSPQRARFPSLDPFGWRARRLLADSPEPPRGEEGGGGEAGGDRRPPLRRPGREGRAEQQTWRGSWRPGAEGVLGTRGACGIASPAQHCPSFPLLVSPPTARGGGEGCGCGRCARAFSGRLRTPRPGAGASPTDAPATARGRVGPVECLGCSQPSPAQTASVSHRC